VLFACACEARVRLCRSDQASPLMLQVQRKAAG
jgi:hypothetical protein